MTSRNAVPHKCPVCCDSLVETEDGVVPNWYGRLVFSTDPPNPTCVNCGTRLMPSQSAESNAQVA